MERWKPNVTVATIVERINSQNVKEYLFVHETRDGNNVYNQPAGHLDEGESLVDAAKRETLEEAGWEVEITGLIGIYRFIAPNGITYMRHAFSARAIEHHANMNLDEGIIEATWLTFEQIHEQKHKMRSQMVIETIEDYEKGEHFPLSLLKENNSP